MAFIQVGGGAFQLGFDFSPVCMKLPIWVVEIEDLPVGMQIERWCYCLKSYKGELRGYYAFWI